jgi:outer membrane beta-barrel protein
MTTSTVKTLACAAALAILVPRTAFGSAADAFENKVKPVSGQLYTKAGKIELTPAFQMSMNDAFFSKYMVGARLAYHFSEYLSLGVNGMYAFSNNPTGSTLVCSGSTGCRDAEPHELYQVPGHLKFVVGAELGISPLYGKLNIFAEKALHFDLSLFVGGDLVSYRSILSSADASTAENAGTTPSDETSLGGHLGLGGRIFFGHAMALDLQVRELGYWTKGLQTNFQTQLIAQAGVAFFFPVVSRSSQ